MVSHLIRNLLAVAFVANMAVWAAYMLDGNPIAANQHLILAGITFLIWRVCDMAAPEALLILLPLIALGAAFLHATCDDEGRS